MRRSIYILIAFVLFNLNTYYSQKNFEATYEITYKPVNFDSIIEGNKKNIKNGEISTLIEKRLKKLEANTKYLYQINYKLLYNRESSFFFKLPQLSLEERRMKVLLAYLGIRNHKYYFKENKIIHSLNAYGEDFLIELPNINWNITREEKKIGKFNCFRATAIIERENSKGKFYQNIVAWFAPEIPFNYGPKEYVGLPGLVVEVQENDMVGYRLKNIRAKKHKKINLPALGKQMKFSEFNDLGRKMFSNKKN